MKVERFSIVTTNGKRKVIIENICSGVDKRKEAVDIIMKNK